MRLRLLAFSTLVACAPSDPSSSSPDATPVTDADDKACEKVPAVAGSCATATPNTCACTPLGEMPAGGDVAPDGAVSAPSGIVLAGLDPAGRLVVAIRKNERWSCPTVVEGGPFVEARAFGRLIVVRNAEGALFWTWLLTGPFRVDPLARIEGAETSSSFAWSPRGLTYARKSDGVIVASAKTDVYDMARGDPPWRAPVALPTSPTTRGPVRESYIGDLAWGGTDGFVWMLSAPAYPPREPEETPFKTSIPAGVDVFVEQSRGTSTGGSWRVTYLVRDEAGHITIDGKACSDDVCSGNALSATHDGSVTWTREGRIFVATAGDGSPFSAKEITGLDPALFATSHSGSRLVWVAAHDCLVHESRWPFDRATTITLPRLVLSAPPSIAETSL